MATYTETINIVVNDADVMAANTALNTLKTSINNLNNRHIRIQGADSLKSMVSTYKSLLNTIGKQSNMSGVNNVLKQFTRLQSKMGKGIEIKVHEGNLKSAVTSINKLTAEMQELRSVAKSVDLSSIGKNTGSTGRINSQLEQINTTLKQIKSNSKIDIKITQSGVNVNGIQQSVTGVQRNVRGMQRSASGVNGHNHTGNYFGFYADDSPLYQYGSALKQTTRRMQMASEKINLIGTNLAMFASYAGVKEMTDIMIETPAKAEVQKYLLSEMQGDTVTHDVKNVTGKGVGAEATLYEQLDKMTDKLPISMQNVVQPLYAWNAANGNEPDDLSRAISSMSNFGAQVLNMTGSEERAQTAMEKLSYAFNGQFQAVDQFGISEKSMEKHGFKKEWQGDVEHVEDFWNAVDEITGDATKSMHNFNGMKATVSKDFSRSGKKVWNNFLGPLATTGLSAFHEFDSAFGGIPTQLIAVGSAGLSMATSLTMLIGSAGTAVGAFSEATASFRVMRKNGGGLKEFFKVFSASSFNDLNRYGYGGNYGKLNGTMGNVVHVENPHLASIDGKMNGVISEVGTNTAADTIDDVGYKKGQKTPAQERADKRRQAKKDKETMSGRNPYKDMERNAGIAAMYGGVPVSDKPKPDKPVRGNNRISKRLNEWSAGLRKGTGSFNYLTRNISKATSAITGMGKSALSFMTSTWMLVPLTLALGAGISFYNNAVKSNTKVAEANERLNTAIEHAKTSLTTQIGDFFNNQGWTEHGGEEGAYEGLITAINAATDAIYALPFVDKQDKYYSDAPKPEEDRDLPIKKENIRNVDWMASAGHLLLDRFDVLPTAKLITGGKSIPDSIDSWAETERERIRNTNYSGQELARNMEQYTNKLTERNRENRQNEAEYKAKDTAKKVETPSYSNLTKTEADDLKHHGSIREKTGSDLWSDLTNTKNNIDSKLPKFDLGQWFQNTFGGGKQLHGQYQNAQGSQVIQTNSVELQGQNGSGGGGILSQIGKALGQTGLGSLFMGGLGTSSAANPAQAGATQPQGFNLDSLFTNIQTSIQSKMPEISNMFNTSLSQTLATADFSLVGQQLSTNLSNSIQTSFNSTQIDLSGFFSNITSQLSSHSGEFNTSGNEGGTQYKSGFGTGIEGTSGIASGEASSILSALDISAEAYAKGKAAGEAYARGYKEGSDVNSPGLAARTARQEGQYILTYMKNAISPIYYTAREMGASMASGFAREGSLGYNGVSFGNVQQQNTAGYIMSNTSGGGNVNHNTLNFNIAKIDSRERAKEVAEYATQMLKWNNETAGRTTEV